MFLAVVLSLALPLDARAQGKPTAATAWYDPEQVAAQSALFKTASDQTGPRFLAIEGQLRRISPALEDLELASALAADALGPKTKTWAQGRRRLALQQRALAQSQVDELQEAYIAAFDAALQRALRARKDGAGAVECSAGSGMQAMMRRQPACPGTDLSAELARQMDQDPLLQAEVQRLSALPWPKVELPAEPQEVLPLTGSAGYIELAPLARALMAARVQARGDDFDRAVSPLAEAIDQGDTSAISKAGEARQRWERALKSDGLVLLPLVEEALGRLKKGAGAEVGLCVNPAVLGGCAGTDRSAELIPLLAADKKLARAIGALP